MPRKPTTPTFDGPLIGEPRRAGAHVLSPTSSEVAQMDALARMNVLLDFAEVLGFSESAVSVLEDTVQKGIEREQDCRFHLGVAVPNAVLRYWELSGKSASSFGGSPERLKVGIARALEDVARLPAQVPQRRREWTDWWKTEGRDAVRNDFIRLEPSVGGDCWTLLSPARVTLRTYSPDLTIDQACQRVDVDEPPPSWVTGA